MRVYLGCAIDYSNNANKNFDYLAGLFDGSSHILFNPLKAYHGGQNAIGETATWIFDLNMLALKTADVAVFLVDGAAKSVGVPMEIGYCMQSGKKFILITNNEDKFGVCYRAAAARAFSKIVDEGESTPRLLTNALREAQALLALTEMEAVKRKWENEEDA